MLNKLTLFKSINFMLLLSQVNTINAQETPSKEIQENDPFLADLMQNLVYLKDNTDLKPQDDEPTSRTFERPSSLKVGNVKEAKHYARLAGASYCSDNNLSTWSCDHCNHVKIQHVDTYFHKETESRAYIAKDTSKKEIILSFRGSSTLKNFIQDAKIKKDALNLGKDKLWVHLGFKQCSDGLLPKYLPTLKDLLNKNKGYKLVVVGHSLGGAIGVISTLMIRDKLKLKDDLLKVYTYGEPRVGDKDFARYLNRQSFGLTRIVNGGDIVPHLPPKLKLISNYYHHQHEIWLNNNREVTCGDEYLEDPKCSASKWYKPSVSDHLKVWDIKLGGTC